MIDSTINMIVPPEKMKEVIQTFKAILQPIRSEKGCISCNCYVDVEKDTHVIFTEEWMTQNDLRIHLQSGHFDVLMGAMALLKKAPVFTFNTIASTVGVEAVTEARHG